MISKIYTTITMKLREISSKVGIFDQILGPSGGDFDQKFS